MVGGIDRYYQIATCWRDEDLRADRQFEFRQLDLELAFAEREDVLDVMEAAVVASFEALGREAPPRPFPRLAYDDVMLRFGTDKPDLRYGMEIQDATEVTRGSEFGVFAGAPCVRYFVAPEGVLARRARRGSRRSRRSGGRRASPTSSSTRAASAALRSRSSSPRRSSPRSRPSPARRSCSAPASPSWSPACSAGCACISAASSASLRPGEDVFHWVLDFPLFERDEPGPLDVPAPSVHGADARAGGVGRARSRRGIQGQHYDLIWNGWELGSGSIRIHDVEMQRKVFRTMGLSDEEADSKFGFLLEALAMGAPPHGGFAMGIERFVALMAGEPDIRQVIAFPKVSSGSDPLTGAPTPMPEATLAELGIKALPQDNSSSA